MKYILLIAFCIVTAQAANTQLRQRQIEGNGLNHQIKRVLQGKTDTPLADFGAYCELDGVVDKDGDKIYSRPNRLFFDCAPGLQCMIDYDYERNGKAGKYKFWHKKDKKNYGRGKCSLPTTETVYDEKTSDYKPMVHSKKNWEGVTEVQKFVCRPGEYLETGIGCTPCPAGYYCESVNGVKKQCPAGTYSAEGTTQCYPSCPAGHECHDVSKAYKCQAGTYSDEGASECTTCPAGTYSDEGATSCTPCAPGEYSRAGATSCTPCAPGEYSKPGSEKCEQISDQSCEWNSDCLGDDFFCSTELASEETLAEESMIEVGLPNTHKGFGRAYLKKTCKLRIHQNKFGCHRENTFCAVPSICKKGYCVGKKYEVCDESKCDKDVNTLKCSNTHGCERVLFNDYEYGCKMGATCEQSHICCKMSKGKTMCRPADEVDEDDYCTNLSRYLECTKDSQCRSDNCKGEDDKKKCV